MMIKRPFWISRIESAWKKRSVVWLSGVRRVGKTSLVKMFPGAMYVNCDLPSSMRRLSDPEAFFKGINKPGILIFDEVHKLPDPSSVLKIAADEYPGLKVLATGSSTLEATGKFRDSLTGRKTGIYLSPILWTECREVFHNSDLDHRLLHGGLPEPFMMSTPDPEFFLEWRDSFYARDIQELFNLRNREGFYKLMEILLRQSSGQSDYTELAKLSGLSRPSVMTYLEAMRIANFIFPLKPYHGGSVREILKRPKVYAFDTGFIAFSRGWTGIRDEDRGLLWEHLVLDLLRAEIPDPMLFYWQDKSGREIDFVVKRFDGSVDLIECKINPDQFNPETLKLFRQNNPAGRNYCLSPNATLWYSGIKDGLAVQFQDRI